MTGPWRFEEAIGELCARLERDSFATLRINVDNGLYRATYGSVVGEQQPILTDALASLVELLGVSVVEEERNG